MAGSPQPGGSGPKGLAVGAVGLLLVGIAALALVPALLAGQSCDKGASGGADPAPTGEARKGIPANYLQLYRKVGRDTGIPWNIIAAIGSVETDHGRLKAPGVRSGQNTNGCCAGPMQFSNIASANTWGAYAVDGNRDGKKDIYDPEDAIPAAGRYLKASGGAKNIDKAIFAYNHAGWYVAKVRAQARVYAGKDTSQLASAPNGGAGAAGGEGCADDGGTSTATGKWKLAPGANAAGRPLTPKFRRFVDRMAGAYKGKLVLTTGTNHSKYSTSGNVSDHYSGNAGDFGMVLNGGANNSPTGDRIAAAAFMAMGLPRGEAVKRGRQGGAQTVVRNGARLQVIWKSQVGGDHTNHVHAGLSE